MRFGLSGALEVRDDAGGLVDVGGRQPRLRRALLLLRPRRPMAARGAAISAADHLERGHRLAIAQGAFGVARRIADERERIS